MYPARFDYVKVDSFSSASATLLSAGAGAKVLAGGQTLIPMLKLRLLKPELIIDLGGISGASDITVDRACDRDWRVGSARGDRTIGGAARVSHYRRLRHGYCGYAGPQYGHDRRIRGGGRSMQLLAGASGCARRWGIVGGTGRRPRHESARPPCRCLHAEPRRGRADYPHCSARGLRSQAAGHSSLSNVPRRPIQRPAAPCR